MVLDKEGRRHLQLAQKALANAESYALDASLLATRPSYGHAVGIGILGLEEAGKAFYFLLRVLGLPTANVDKKMRTTHPPKQVFGIFATVVSKFSHELLPLIQQATSGDPGVDWKFDLAAVRTLIPKIEAFVEQIPAAALEEDKMHEAERGGLQTFKHMGLYVDVDEAGVPTSPEDVSVEDYEGVKIALDSAVRFVRMFGAPVFSGDVDAPELDVIKGAVDTQIKRARQRHRKAKP